jgi:hypothetical protein
MLYSSFLSSADPRLLQQPERERIRNSAVFWRVAILALMVFVHGGTKSSVVAKLAFASTRHY